MKWNRRKGGVEGDILGISDVPPASGATPARDRDSHPDGIEVRTPATGIDDVPRRRGETDIDMGAGGEGEAISRNPRSGG